MFKLPEAKLYWFHRFLFSLVTTFKNKLAYVIFNITQRLQRHVCKGSDNSSKGQDLISSTDRPH